MHKYIKLIDKHVQEYNKTELMYPNRMKEIHKTACKNCPSVFNKKNNITDLETEQIKKESRNYQLQSVFPCGWRGSKLCKGYCDELKIKETDLLITADKNKTISNS